MDSTTIAMIAILMGLAAVLYSTVGHGGASAYLAIMALFAVAPETMRPTALALNLIVAGLGSWRYWRAGQTNVKLLLIFAVTAVPAAFIGGGIKVAPEIYRPLVGVMLWLAALRLFWQPSQLAKRDLRPVSAVIALPVGALLGLLAGLTGTGGGIFLSPLIILFGWEDARRTSGVVAGFILLNSIAGLAGNVASVRALPAELPYFAVAVVLGAIVGTWLGVGRLPKPRLLQGLGLVLAIAGAKLIFT
jgi:uncharacterized membrane protein YfcA